MFQRINAIVLRTIKHNDTTLVVDLYSEQNGHVALLASVPARKQGRKQVRTFQPLSSIEAEATNRPTARLNRIKEARATHPFQSIPANPYKTAIVLYLSEFLYRALHNETANPLLYAYLEKSMLWLDECKCNFSNFHIVFLMRLSRFLGLYPNLEDYAAGDWFDLRAACFTPLRPAAHNDCLPPDEAARMARLMRMDYATMHLFRLTREERARCLEVILTYYRLHLPDLPELRSVEVLREVFL